MDPKKEKKVVQLIKNHLIKSRKLNIPGLGVFEINHHKQRQEQKPDGQVVLSPPKDEVTFKAQKSSEK